LTVIGADDVTVWAADAEDKIVSGVAMWNLMLVI
jgi:hypothetical protein